MRVMHRADLNVLLVPLVVTGAMLLALLAGLAQAEAPIIGPVLIIGVVASPLFLVVPLEYQVIGILVALLCSRLLLLIGAPSLITYAHFGLLLLMMVSLVLRRVMLPVSLAPLSRHLYRLTTLMALAIAASAAINGWYAFRPILAWLTWTEPFVVLAVVASLPAPARKRVRMVLMGLAIVQIPFAVVQFAQYGASDDVKGTLIAQGAGHHILGAIGVIGGLMIVVDNARGEITSRFLAAFIAPLFVIGMMSDAKQVYGAFTIAALPFLLPMIRARPSLAIVGAAVFALFFFAGPLIDSSFSNTFNQQDVTKAASMKFGYAPSVIGRLHASTLIFGDGPGNGTSRVAQLSLPTYGTVPTWLVGTHEAPLLSLQLMLDAQTWAGKVGGVSSTNGPFYSVMSLFTDLGLLGCLIYAATGIAVWRSLSRLSPFDRTMGQLLLLMALVLGMIFTWLEEPVFTVFLAAAIGTMESAPGAVTALQPSIVPLASHRAMAHAYPHRP